MKGNAPAAKADEAVIQKHLIEWWAYSCRRFDCEEDELYAVPNGEKRDIVTGARLKAQGVRRGVPDLQLDVPKFGKYLGKEFHGLRLELKKPDGRVSPEQSKVLNRLRRRGHCSVVAYSYEAGCAALIQYCSGQWFSQALCGRRVIPGQCASRSCVHSKEGRCPNRRGFYEIK